MRYVLIAAQYIVIAFGYALNWLIASAAMYYFFELIKAPYSWQIGTAAWTILLCIRFVRKTVKILWEDAVWYG